MAGGGVPTQYKGREHVWHAMVDKFAAGGAAQPAALIDGNNFVKAAQANGLKTDNATLNKIVARVNKGESVDQAAKNVAQSRAGGGEVQMGAGGLLKGIVKGAQKVLPAAEREANLAKMLEVSKVKERLYHGTDKDFSEFKFNPKKSMGTWLTNRPKLASAYSEVSARGGDNSIRCTHK